MEEFRAFRKRRIRRLIITRQRVRDMNDPFNMTKASFKKRYRHRLTQDLARSLVRIVRPHMAVRTSATAVPLERRVLAALAFYGHGCYQTPVGDRFDLGIAQPTVSVILVEVTNALNTPEVVSELIKFPLSAHEVNACIQRNRQMGVRIPNTLGFVDGSLIRIVSPPQHFHPPAYMGRKKFHCINVQYVCDSQLQILNVLARFPGGTFDSFIFHRSAVRDRMILLNNHTRCHLLGDSGYALEPWLLTPFARQDRPAQEDSPEAGYNRAHAQDRNAVRRCIGVKKGRFRCLHKDRALHYDPPKCCKLVVACTVLHNLCVRANVPHDGQHGQDSDDSSDDDEEEDAHDNDNDGNDANVLLRGREARMRAVQLLEIRRNNQMLL